MFDFEEETTRPKRIEDRQHRPPQGGGNSRHSAVIKSGPTVGGWRLAVSGDYDNARSLPSLVGTELHRAVKSPTDQGAKATEIPWRPF